MLDRIGRIDPEFREARELLGTLEVHRLVLPAAAEISLPPDLLGQTNGSAPSPAQQSLPDETQPTLANADLATAARETQPDESLDGPDESPVRQAESATSSEQLPLDKVAAEPYSQESPAPPADQDASTPTGAAAPPIEEPDEPATAASFSTFDWARHLIERSEWTEAERVLTDIVTANDPDTARVDGLLLQAVAHRELRGSAWKLLGDHYMQTGRPQPAADAYLRAANVAGRSTQ